MLSQLCYQGLFIWGLQKPWRFLRWAFSCRRLNTMGWLFVLHHPHKVLYERENIIFSFPFYSQFILLKLCHYQCIGNILLLRKNMPTNLPSMCDEQFSVHFLCFKNGPETCNTVAGWGFATQHYSISLRQ